MDSQSAIAIAISKNPQFHDRTKHIEVRCYACFWYVSDCLLSSCGFTIRIGIAGYHSGTPVL
jgi:hypothetical protein